VTNDLVFDQRMIRICNSLAEAGYDVLLIGRNKKNSPPLLQQKFRQKRLSCFSQKGKLFYIEYNIRLFFYLLFLKTDCYCAIDLDSILPNLFASMLRKKKRVYDAHELFCEMQEIISRPAIHKIWKGIEAFAVPRFKNGYTIGGLYRAQFKEMYGVNYEIVRNATVLNQENQAAAEKEKHLYYQGAVNEGRCFERLIPALASLEYKMLVCGSGNYFEQAKALSIQHGLENRIKFMGYLDPIELKNYTQEAYVGITLFEESGKSNYYSLGNRFFDYMHWGVPQLCVAYPEYVAINEEFEVAYLVADTSIESLQKGIRKLMEDDAYYNGLKANCFKAREKYNWQAEEKKLIAFYKKLFG